MKAVERHLYSRNGYLYYRSAIPRKYQALLSIKETVIALHSKDRREARVIAAQLNLAEQGILKSFYDELGALPLGASPERAILTVLKALESLRVGSAHIERANLHLAVESKKPAKILEPWILSFDLNFLGYC